MSKPTRSGDISMRGTSWISNKKNISEILQEINVFKIGPLNLGRLINIYLELIKVGMVGIVGIVAQ